MRPPGILQPATSSELSGIARYLETLDGTRDSGQALPGELIPGAQQAFV